MPRAKKEIDQSNITKLCDALENTKYADKISLLKKQQSCPLIESITNDPKNKRVTFFYHDQTSECRAVNICSQIGYLPSLLQKFGENVLKGSSNPKQSLELPKIPMEKIGNNVWAVTVDLPTELCDSYVFEVQTEKKPKLQLRDPLNNQIFYFSTIEQAISCLDLLPHTITKYTEMSALKKAGQENKYPQLKKYSIDAQGKITKRSFDYESKTKDERLLTVHFPKEYDPNDPDKTYPVRLFLDGKWYSETFEVPTILPDDGTINIMLEPQLLEFDIRKDREREYCTQKKEFAEFLATKFMPAIQKELNASTDAREVTICGSSYSGYGAIYAGLHYPEIFGNVLAQSTAFWFDAANPLAKQLKLGTFNLEKLKNSFFYLGAGILEGYYVKNPGEATILEANKDFAELLSKFEIPCHLEIRPTAHNYCAWYTVLPDDVQSLQDKRIELSYTTALSPTF